MFEFFIGVPLKFHASCTVLFIGKLHAVCAGKILTAFLDHSAVVTLH